MTGILDTVAAKLASGEPLEAADAEALLAAPDLVSLGMLAEEARRRRHGDRVTFLRVAHLDVSSASGAIPLPAAAGEVRLGGAPASLDEAVAAVRAALARAGRVPLTAFTLARIGALADQAGCTLADALSRLRDAGLERVASASLDWTGFEDACSAATAAGVAIARVVVDDARADWLTPARRLGRLVGENGIARVLAPLPQRVSEEAPTTGYEDLKRIAVARLAVPDVESIQVDWAVYGPKLAQVALTFGADDLDNVAAVEDEALGPRRAVLEAVRRNIRAAGLLPVERDGRWEATSNE